MTFEPGDKTGNVDNLSGSENYFNENESSGNKWPFKIDNLTSSEFDVIALGHAIVDIMVATTEEILDDNGFTKGTMQLTDSGREGEEILKKLKSQGELTDILMTSGGSAGNTIYALAKLGFKTGFFGTVFDDELGRHYINDLEKSGVKCFFSPKTEQNFDAGSNESYTTGRCNVFITPDKDRTMLTYLGASAKFNPDEINGINLASSAVVYVEGYLFDSVSGTEAILVAAEQVKDSSSIFSLSLSDPFVVDRYRHVILNLIEDDKIDLIFGNMTEAEILSGKESINDIADFFNNKGQLAVITDGANGSYLISGSRPIFVTAIKSDKVEDTTGAGDTFAAGVIAGLLKGFTVEKSLGLGAIVAKEVIEHIGPRPNDDIDKVLGGFGIEI